MLSMVLGLFVFFILIIAYALFVNRDFSPSVGTVFGYYCLIVIALMGVLGIRIALIPADGAAN